MFSLSETRPTPLRSAARRALLAASSVGASGGEEQSRVFVVPPGQEAVIAGMLGKSMALPECTLVGCGVDYMVIEATYRCRGEDVALELGHPQQVTDPAAVTAQFAVTVERGTPPPNFQDAFLSLVRSREHDFAWAWAEIEAEAESGAAAE